MNEDWQTNSRAISALELTPEELEQMRTAIRDRLEKTAKGNVASSIANCLIVLRYDPIFSGKIRRNELTGCTDIVGNMPWQREGTLLSDKENLPGQMGFTIIEDGEDCPFETCC